MVVNCILIYFLRKCHLTNGYIVSNNNCHIFSMNYEHVNTQYVEYFQKYFNLDYTVCQF